MPSFPARQYEVPVFFPVFFDKKNQFVKAPVKCRPLHRRHLTHICHSAVSNLEDLFWIGYNKLDRFFKVI